MVPFAYRAFDLRNRFDAPFVNITDALNALFSEKAYLPEEAGEIVAYYPNGTKLKVPSEFFIVRKPEFSTVEEAKLWLSKRNKQISDSPNGRAFGVAIADPLDDLEKQLSDAMSFKVVELNREKTVGQLAKEIEHWLNNNAELAE